MRLLARVLASIALLTILCHSTPVQSQEPIAIGLHDLVVFDPGVHERGLPNVLFTDAQASHGDGSYQKIEIPPTVHVHRYYYSGDKEIQGPIITGGPTIVVAKHPHTGEQMYVDVMLPAGAPKIAYNQKCITYVYPKQRVCIHFRHFPFDPDRAVVTHLSGHGVRRRVNEYASDRLARAKNKMKSSPAVESIKKAGDQTRQSLGDLGDQAVVVAEQVHSTFKAAVSIIPGVTPLMNPSDDGASRSYANEVRAATSRNDRTAAEFTPTLR